MRTHHVLAIALAAALLALPITSAQGDNPPPPPKKPCGAATDPLCWAPKMACEVYGPLVNGTPLQCRNFTGPSAIGEILVLSSGASAPELAGVDTQCKNFGVVIMITGVGENHYCVDGDCENDGLIVMVGASDGCMGRGYLIVCWASTCVRVPRTFTGPDVLEVGTLASAA